MDHVGAGLPFLNAVDGVAGERLFERLVQIDLRALAEFVRRLLFEFSTNSFRSFCCS
jgi:hypothetical protein